MRHDLYYFVAIVTKPFHLLVIEIAVGILTLQAIAINRHGPPLAVYGAPRRWSPEHFRATLQGYFLPASVMGMIGYWAAGQWTPSVSRYYLLSLPTALLAIVATWTAHQPAAR